MSVQVTDIPSIVHEYLVDEFGDSQDERSRGYFISQSFKHLMEFLDDDQIIEMRGRRHVKNKSESYPTLTQGRVGDYTKTEEQIRVAFELDYDRAKHGPFSSEAVEERIKEKDLEDIPIERVVFRQEAEQLHEQLQQLLVDALGLKYTGEFEQPFYYVMEGKQADRRHIKQQVQDYHDSHYFTRKDGLGWKVRTLDLMAIWSHRAFTGSDNVLFTDPEAGRKLTMEDVENLAFNQYATDEPKYGAVNSKLVINNWRSTFGRGRTDMRVWQWSEGEGSWEREK